MTIETSELILLIRAYGHEYADTLKKQFELEKDLYKFRTMRSNVLRIVNSKMTDSEKVEAIKLLF